MQHLFPAMCLSVLLSLGTIGCVTRPSISVASSADLPKGAVAYQSGDYATALREWTPLAKQGNALAQFILGVMYAEGQGVPKNYKTAVKWYALAAEQGDAYGQSNLGEEFPR